MSTLSFNFLNSDNIRPPTFFCLLPHWIVCTNAAIIINSTRTAFVNIPCIWKNIEKLDWIKSNLVKPNWIKDAQLLESLAYGLSTKANRQQQLSLELRYLHGFGRDPPKGPEYNLGQITANQDSSNQVNFDPWSYRSLHYHIHHGVNAADTFRIPNKVTDLSLRTSLNSWTWLNGYITGHCLVVPHGLSGVL